MLLRLKTDRVLPFGCMAETPENMTGSRLEEILLHTETHLKDELAKRDRRRFTAVIRPRPPRPKVHILARRRVRGLDRVLFELCKSPPQPEVLAVGDGQRVLESSNVLILTPPQILDLS